MSDDWRNYVPSTMPNKHLCGVVRHSYVLARRRSEKINGHSSRYMVNSKQECVQPSPYAVFIENALRNDFNPVQLLQAELNRIVNSGVSSTIPWLMSLQQYQKHDPVTLNDGYRIKSRASIYASDERVKLRFDIDEDMHAGVTLNDVIESLADEIDPVYYVTMLETNGVLPNASKKVTAAIRYASCDEVYDEWFAATVRISRPKYLVSFREWEYGRKG